MFEQQQHKSYIELDRSMAGEFQPKRRITLEAAILEAAITDYQAISERKHEDASMLLFPQDKQYRNHWSWLTAGLPGVDPSWLRCVLDSARPRWDATRQARKPRRRVQ